MGMLEKLTARSGREPVAPHADFRRALTREILLTERLRVKALIVTVVVLMVCTLTAFAIAPANVERIWHGSFAIRPVLATGIPFIIFELSVLRILTQRLAVNADVSMVRRY